MAKQAIVAFLHTVMLNEVKHLATRILRAHVPREQMLPNVSMTCGAGDIGTLCVTNRPKNEEAPLLGATRLLFVLCWHRLTLPGHQPQYHQRWQA